MTPENKPPENVKPATVTVTLQPPPPEPVYEFLNRRVDTEMYYCGDVESINSNDERFTSLLMASGQLLLIVNNEVRQRFAYPLNELLNKNICVKGLLMRAGDSFTMEIQTPGQIWLSGH